MNLNRTTFSQMRALGTVALLLCRAAFAQTIPNPSFETDTFTVSPGSISSNTAITGWTGTPTDRVGLNPAGGSPFANNGTVPAGNNVAFIQANEADPGTPSTLATTISGLAIGTTYKVTFRANASTTNTPNLKVYLDGAPVWLPGGSEGMAPAPVTGTSPYWFIAFEFTATAGSQALAIVNDAVGDQTLLVDDFQIAPSSGRWTVDAWNDDADSGVDPSFFYTHAYKFGAAGNVTLNNINFIGVGGTLPNVPGSFSSTFLGAGPVGDAFNFVTGNGAAMAAQFVYGGNVPAGSFESITVSGLTPGTNYVMTIYSVAWDDPTENLRWVTASAAGDYLTFNQDQFLNDGGIRISYSYTADPSGTMVLKFAPVIPGTTFHVYGFANREAVSRFVAPIITTDPQSTIVSPDVQATFNVTASGVPLPTYQWRFGGTAITDATNASYSLVATSINAGLYDVIVANTAGSVTSQVARLTVGNISIVNPSFEVDGFPLFPGYVSDNGPITGWASLDNDGLNPAAGSPFADNGITPNGTQVAFMQGDGAFSQTVTNLTVGAQYYVHYYENARAGNTPALEVQVGGNTVVASHIINSVGGGNPYHEVSSAIFTASATDLDLSFIKSNPLGGDTTALIDNVAILLVPTGTPPSITLQPEGGIFVEGDNVLLSVNVFGSQPVTYQWKKDGSNLPGETGTSLSLTSVTTNNTGTYSVAVTNSSGFAISSNATVTVAYRSIPGVFGTGVDANGVLLDAGATDPHYIMSVSADPSFPGPDAIVINEGFPINPWLANGPDSKWIAPMADQATGNAEGDYTYQTTFDLTGYDLSKVSVVGSWAVDNTGIDILINGVSTGITSPGFDHYVSFTITNGLLAGVNTLDFKMNNAPATPNPTGLRVNLKGLLSLESSQPSVALQIGRSGNSVTISWSPSAPGQKLLSAPSVSGPWTEIINAPNPYVTTPSAASAFYRIAQ